MEKLASLMLTALRRITVIIRNGNCAYSAATRPRVAQYHVVPRARSEMAVTWVSLLIGALALLFLYLMNNIRYWQNRGIRSAKGASPGVGHMWSLVTAKESFYDICGRIYNDNKDHSVVGYYNFVSPTLLIIDPKIVKEILQTKFTNFHENNVKVNPDLDPLLANNPFFSYGEKWTIGRKRLTYAFSSMRLKTLLECVKQVCEELENYLDKRLSKTEKVELELKNVFAKFTTQVVASAGFGVDGFCFEEKEGQKSFRQIGEEIFNPSSLSSILITVGFLIPWVAKVCRVRFLSKKYDHFFRMLVADVLEQRRTTDVQRNDFIQLMVELERMEGDKFDIEVLASHAVSFFIDGSETSSSTLAFAGFHIASNPEVQERLREEVVTTIEKHGGKLTYEALREMTYMDQVFSESERMLPVVPIMSKICTESIDLTGSDGVTYHFETGDCITIPNNALQNDPRHWDNPDVFDPERFSLEKKHTITKCTFLPFSDGPRACVGMRMAQLQMKACIAMLLKKYSLELSPKTEIPLKMIPTAFLPTPRSGLWIYLQRL